MENLSKKSFDCYWHWKYFWRFQYCTEAFAEENQTCAKSFRNIQEVSYLASSRGLHSLRRIHETWSSEFCRPTLSRDVGHTGTRSRAAELDTKQHLDEARSFCFVSRDLKIYWKVSWRYQEKFCRQLETTDSQLRPFFSSLSLYLSLSLCLDVMHSHIYAPTPRRVYSVKEEKSFATLPHLFL